MNLVERDKKHLWHPLTQHKLGADAIAITRAKGCLLFDDQGNRYIDAIASWYTCMMGHCNAQITMLVTHQMQQLDHCVFAGFTHKPAIELSESLISLLPTNQQKVFFSDNGSTANEVAIKMSLQYHFNHGHKKTTIIAFENGFHGDTFGAMSASGLSVYNGPFEDFFIDVQRIPVPDANNIEQVKGQLKKIISTNKVAAFIYEPLVQGANAMNMYHGEYLNQLLEICKNNSIICIADEVMTGFGKTGKNFASDHIKTKPDIICLSKALTAGLVPMAITSCTQEIYNAFLDDKMEKAFLHAHTYTANPVACSAALAAVNLLKTEEIQNNIQHIISSHQVFDHEIKSHPKIAGTRQLGVIYAIDLDVQISRYGKQRNQIFDFFMKQGVYLRPLGKTIYLVPPFVITSSELNKVYQSIRNFLNEYCVT